MTTATAPAVVDRTTIRTQLRTIPKEQFIKASTRDVLVEKAKTLGAEVDDAMSKQDLYAAMIDIAKLPNPALRGKSSIDEPVSFVWHHCDTAASNAAAAGQLAPKRSQVIKDLQALGVAFYTARTQYQAWFSATDKGRKRILDLAQDELPRSMRDPIEDSDEE